MTTIRSATRSFTPPTDVIELDDKIMVVVEIAGMRPNALSITLLQRHLIISGVRERPQHMGAAYHQVEIGFGEFRVEIALPGPVDRESVSASYENGFLQIELPRQPVRQIRVVELNTAEQ